MKEANPFPVFPIFVVALVTMGPVVVVHYPIFMAWVVAGISSIIGVVMAWRNRRVVAKCMRNTIPTIHYYAYVVGRFIYYTALNIIARRQYADWQKGVSQRITQPHEMLRNLSLTHPGENEMRKNIQGCIPT
ncbi:MAG: hypothetical protein Q7T51_02880 [Candidatus Moranbacteria bacterium]|nr:hypothetical protein [Candidatus Moranbacteria bacterium]